jgi:hypothetical protein
MCYLKVHVSDTKLFLFLVCAWTKNFSSDFQFFFVSSYDIIVKFFFQCLTMLLLSLFLSASYDVIIKFVTMSILVRNKIFDTYDLFTFLQLVYNFNLCDAYEGIVS